MAFEISNRHDTCLWKIAVDLDQIPHNETLIVHPGCKAVGYLDGEPRYYKTNQKPAPVINCRPGFLQRGEDWKGKKFEIIAGNETVLAAWGVSGIPYVSKEGIKTTAGFRGNMTFEFFDVGSAYHEIMNLWAAQKGNVTAYASIAARDIVDLTRAQLNTIVSEEIIAYSGTNKTAIAESIKRRYHDVCAPLGFGVTTFTFANIDDPTLPEDYYDQLTQLKADKMREQQEKEERDAAFDAQLRAEREEQRKRLEEYEKAEKERVAEERRIAEAKGKSAENAALEKEKKRADEAEKRAAKAEEDARAARDNVGAKFCPNCGAPRVKGANFCARCGRSYR